MAWELRNDGRNRYYYRRRTSGGRRFKEYVGCGPRAEQQAAGDVRRRTEREADRQALRGEHERWQTAWAALTGFAKASDQLMHAALHAAGFHRHAGGAWRHRQR